MRILPLLFLALALSGCFATDEEPEDEASVWGTCPQWISGDHASTLRLDVNGSREAVLDLNVTQRDGHPLDLYGLHVGVEGDVTLRFFHGDRQLGVSVLEPEPAMEPLLRLQDAEADVQVFLTAVAHGTAPAPSPLGIRAEGQGTVVIEATPWFRVCGEPL